MVKSLKFLRHRRTDAGYFSEFLIAKTPDDLENRQPATVASASTLILAPTVVAAPVIQQPQPQPQYPAVSLLSLYSLPTPPTTVARLEEVPVSPAAGPLHRQSPRSQQQQQQQQQHLKADPLRVVRRRERNRAAAAKCRQRRQDRLEYLADCVRQLEEANGELEAEVSELDEVRLELEAALRSHQAICDAPAAAAAIAAAAAAALASPTVDQQLASSAVWLAQPPMSPKLATAAPRRPTSLSLSDDLEPPSLLSTPRGGVAFDGGSSGSSGLTPFLATPKLESMMLL